MAIKTYSYKLYHTKRTKHIDDLVHLSAEIYNHCIALHKRYYSLYGKHLPKYRLQKHLTKLKATQKKHWNDLGSQAIQNITDRIELSYQSFFKHIKKQRVGRKNPPKFRSRHKYKSFTFKGKVGYKLDGNTLTINSINKTFKFHKSRDYGKHIKTITIKRNQLGEYFVFISCDVEETILDYKPKPMTGKSAGFDFGLSCFLVSSDNVRYDNPTFYRQNLKLLQEKSRSLSKKQKGSNNRKKAKLELARLHRNIANHRECFQWDLANTLVSEYDNLFFEDLILEGMKKRWGRKVNDLSLSEFLNKLKYLSEKHNKFYGEIDRFYASSKTCSCCGNIKKELSLKERVYKCGNCGRSMDRDHNAAVNIKKVGVSTFAREMVSPAKTG